MNAYVHVTVHVHAFESHILATPKVQIPIGNHPSSRPVIRLVHASIDRITG